MIDVFLLCYKNYNTYKIKITDKFSKKLKFFQNSTKKEPYL